MARMASIDIMPEVLARCIPPLEAVGLTILGTLTCLRDDYGPLACRFVVSGNCLPVSCETDILSYEEIPEIKVMLKTLDGKTYEVAKIDLVED